MENSSKKQEPFDLEALEPAKIAEAPRVKEQFIATLQKIHKLDLSEAESIYEKELIYYKKAILESEKLKSATKISLYSAFLEIAINGLSIQPGAKSEAYLETRGFKMKDSQGRETWGQAARLVITAYGELNMRIRAGQIVRMNNPIVIYEGDHFQPRTNEQGVLIVDYAPAIPRKSKIIIGCYVCVVLPKGGLDFKWLLQDDIDRLEQYSIPKSGQNSKANALYRSNNGQIDTGFLETKTIKHAMKAYTKLRVSDNVSMEEDEEPIHPTHSFATEPGDQETVPTSTETVTYNDDNDENGGF